MIKTKVWSNFRSVAGDLIWAKLGFLSKNPNTIINIWHIIIIKYASFFSSTLEKQLNVKENRSLLVKEKAINQIMSV